MQSSTKRIAHLNSNQSTPIDSKSDPDLPPLDSHSVLVDSARTNSTRGNFTSAGRRDQSPYTRFFAKAAPSAVQTYGIQREIDTARAWLDELDRNPAEPLATTWTPQLTQATNNLDEACKARNQAVQSLGSHQTTVTLFVDDVNYELDRLEGQLKQLFPGDAPRVASYLAVTRPQRAAVPDDPQPPAPTPPVPTN
jgi:hypothetical protein